MPALSEHVNVYNTALNTIAQKGFQVWTTDRGNTVCAEREGWDFHADNPVSLLGLIAIFEQINPPNFRDYWWHSTGKLDYRNLPTQPRPYVPIITGREQEGGR